MTLEAAIFSLLAERGPGKSICPSEAARRTDPEDWRDLMDETRAVAADLAREGRIQIMQKGQSVDPNEARGPIRIALTHDGPDVISEPV